jgi:hypothetical protein
MTSPLLLDDSSVSTYIYSTNLYEPQFFYLCSDYYCPLFSTIFWERVIACHITIESAERETKKKHTHCKYTKRIKKKTKFTFSLFVVVFPRVFFPTYLHPASGRNFPTRVAISFYTHGWTIPSNYANTSSKPSSPPRRVQNLILIHVGLCVRIYIFQW